MPPLTPLVKKLIVGLLAAFVLELVLQNFAGINVIGLLSLDPNNLGLLTPLRLVTYVFIEDPRQVMSMLINLVFMWLILSPFEVTFGSRPTLELALCGTVVAGLTVILVAQLAPVPGYMFFGSHPIAYAGMAAMTQVIRGGRIMFFGVVPMTSQTLLLVLGGLSLLQFLATKDHLMLTGSLGAMAAGIGYVRYMARPPRASKPRRGNDPRGPRFRVLRGGGGGSSSDGDSDRPKWLN
jgi:membrane associated rhomboid family serine protease